MLSIDPAAGGEESEEVFVIFLIRSQEIALFGSRIVSATDRNISFTVIPFRFVVALLQTIKDLKAKLFSLFKSATYDLKLPPILIVIETNFAYGAAVYMQYMFFLRHILARDSSFKDIEIIFATAVFGWDSELILWHTEELQIMEDIRDLQDKLKGYVEDTKNEWLLKSSKKKITGMNLRKIQKNVVEVINDKFIQWNEYVLQPIHSVSRLQSKLNKIPMRMQLPVLLVVAVLPVITAPISRLWQSTIKKMIKPQSTMVCSL